MRPFLKTFFLCLSLLVILVAGCDDERPMPVPTPGTELKGFGSVIELSNEVVMIRTTSPCYGRHQFVVKDSKIRQALRERFMDDRYFPFLYDNEMTITEIK